MSILCLNRPNLPDKARQLIHHNHRLYANRHNQNILYHDSLLQVDIDFLLQDEHCLIIGEQYVFVNNNLDYRSLIQKGYLLSLCSSDNIQHINNIYNDILILKTSQWVKLLLQDLNDQQMNIKEYINHHIDMSSVSISLQNIDIISKKILMPISYIKKYKNIPNNILLIDISGDLIDNIIDNVMAINKYLGINYVNAS